MEEAAVKNIVMIGASGAVGGKVLETLLQIYDLERVTLLGRRVIEGLDLESIKQKEINIFQPESYREYLEGHQEAICTLGVGEPSKVDKDTFVKVDKDAVLDFAKECKKADVKSFSLLNSVGADARSKSFFLRTKGELIEGLQDLEFENLSIFCPSMILTPTNRYGFSQAVTLAIWPHLNPILLGPLRKFRGVKVEDIGSAIAHNLAKDRLSFERLYWDDFVELLS